MKSARKRVSDRKYIIGDLKNIFIHDEQRRRQEKREEGERIEGQRRQADVIPLNILMLIQREKCTIIILLLD